MATKRRQANVFAFTQQLDMTYWINWTNDEKKKCGSDANAIMQNVCRRIWESLTGNKPKDAVLFKFSGILHDKDMSFDYDEKKKQKVLVPKTLHIHAVIEFPNKQDLNIVAKVIGVRPEQIEVPRGRYGRENLLAYLIHAKQPDKYQYSPKEVQTFGTWNYMTYYYEHNEQWAYRSATTKKKKNTVRADWLVKQVQQGLISKEQIMLTDDYAEVYADNMREINDAFQFYAERQGYKTLQALKNKEYEMAVYFIQGNPRAGKTHFADNFIENLISNRYGKTGERWRRYNAGDTNPMDDYAGEEIVFMDDLRASSMNASAWLKILDPITVAPMGARYKNKQKACRVIVITSYQDPFTFFSYIKGVGGTNEALEQFIGRLSAIVQVIREDADNRYVLLNGVVQSDKPKRIRIGTEIPSQYKETRFYDEQIGKYTLDDASQILVNDIDYKNDKAKKHDSFEKPQVGFYKQKQLTLGLNNNDDDE